MPTTRTGCLFIVVLLTGCGAEPVVEPATESQTPQPDSAPVANAPTKPTGRVLKSPVDLLQRINLSSDVVQGAFQLDGTGLIVPNTNPSPSYLRLPMDLPDEYVVVIEAERTDSLGGLGMGLVAAGRRFMAVVDGSGGVGGLHSINGNLADQNGTAWRGPLLGQGQLRRIVYTVHRQGIRGEVDGTTIFDWQGDFDKLSLPDSWNKDEHAGLFIGSWKASFRIHKLELHPFDQESQNSRKWLSDLPEQNAKAGWGKFGKNGNCGFENRPIRAAGRTWQKGLGLHPNGQVSYQIDGKYRSFHAMVSLNRSAGDSNWRHPIVFRVHGDNRLLWESRGFTARGQRAICNIDVTGVQQLKLTTHYSPYLANKRDQSSAHAVWLDPYLEKGSPPPRSLPPEVAAREWEGRRDALLELVKRGVELNVDPETGRYVGVELRHAGHFSNRDGEILTKLPALESIYIRGHPELTDKLFLHLKDIPKLRSLEIVQDVNNGITGSGLQHLAGSDLEVLKLGGTLTDEGMVHLPKLTKLKVLTFDVGYEPDESPRMPKVTDKTLQLICQMDSLESLSFGGLYTDEGTRNLGNLKNLKELSASWTATDETLRIIGELPELRSLSLSRLHIIDGGIDYFYENHTDAGLQHLTKLDKLESLSLGFFKITDAGIEHIGKLTSLKRLRIACEQVTDKSMPHLAGLTKIEKLQLLRTGVGEPGLSVIRNFPNLRWLAIVDSSGHHDFSPPGAPIAMDEACRHINNFPQLEQLHLYGTHLSGRGLANLGNLPKLDELLIHDTLVDDEALAHLSRFKSMTGLRVVDTRVTKDGAARFQETLPGCRIQGSGFYLPTRKKPN